MRAREFVTETIVTIPNTQYPHDAESLPGLYVQPQLQNNDAYRQYRYGVAVAAARAIENGELPASDLDKESAFSENLIQVMFCPEDEETIRLASKRFGVTPKSVSSNMSTEHPTTNTRSPVSDWRKSTTPADIAESASTGATSAGNVASAVTQGNGVNVGSLFGGTYQQKPKVKSRTPVYRKK